MNNFVKAALVAGLMTLSSVAPAFACDQPKFEACIGQCEEHYPNDNQTFMRLGCITGCGFATDCMSTTGG